MAKKKSDKRPSERGIAIDGSQVAHYRKLKNLSQEDLADKSGVPLRTIQHAEASENLDPQNLDDLAKALGIPSYFVSPNPSGGIVAHPTSGNVHRITIRFRLKEEVDLFISIEEFLANGYLGRLLKAYDDREGLAHEPEAINAVAGSIIISASLSVDDTLGMILAYIQDRLESFQIQFISLPYSLPSGDREIRIYTAPSHPKAEERDVDCQIQFKGEGLLSCYMGPLTTTQQLVGRILRFHPSYDYFLAAAEKLKRPIPTPPTPQRRSEVHLKVAIPYDDLHEPDQLASFIESLKRIIGGGAETSLVRVTRASESSSFPSDFQSDDTVITLEMGTADVVALNSAFGSTKLNEMRITEIRLPDDFSHRTLIIEGRRIPVKGGTVMRVTPLLLPPESVQPEESKKEEPETKQ